MQAVKIGGNAYRNDVDNLIGRYFSNSRIKIQVEDYSSRFEYSFAPFKKKIIEEFEFYNKMANLVKDIIIEIYVLQIIKDRVAKICIDYSASEKEEIIVSAHSIIKNQDFFTKEKEMVYEEILNYLIENKSIIIDGFMRFRLARFLYVIDISIEKAVGEYEVEKEYLEFLNMLQYFVDIQIPKYDTINVIVRDGDYILLDKDNEIIENGLLEIMPEDPIYDEISKADLLISSLIILAPLELIIHMEEDKEKELTSVISQVFRNKVRFCSGCDMCNIKSKISKK